MLAAVVVLAVLLAVGVVTIMALVARLGASRGLRERAESEAARARADADAADARAAEADEARRAAEAARQAAEESRETAEASRRAAEDARRAAEDARQVAVEAGQAAEAGRQAALEEATRRGAELQAARDAARAEAAEAAARLDEARDRLGDATALAGDRGAALDEATSRIADLEAVLAAAGSANVAPAAGPGTPDAPGAGTAPPAPTATSPAAAGAAWPLLLERWQRQWAVIVGAGPDELGVVGGPPAAQVTQALAREVERLREEVGVSAELVEGEEPDDREPMVLLLAAGEALAALAASSEAVRLTLGRPLVVEGDDWTGDDGELDRLARELAAAGLTAETSVAEGRVVVRLSLGGAAGDATPADGPAAAPVDGERRLPGGGEG